LTEGSLFAAQRLAAQPAPRAMSIGDLPMRRIREWGAAWPLPYCYFHFNRKSKIVIQRSLFERGLKPAPAPALAPCPREAGEAGVAKLLAFAPRAILVAPALRAMSIGSLPMRRICDRGPAPRFMRGSGPVPAPTPRAMSAGDFPARSSRERGKPLPPKVRAAMVCEGGGRLQPRVGRLLYFYFPLHCSL
jgi:hypothetical protein